MQRGLRALWTTPSPVRLMASAGHTSAQVGCSQCMHTTGTVCVLLPRSTNSRWIIDSPLWVSHSWQACTQDWHPMHREGSTKNSRCWGTGIDRSPPYCCGSSSAAYAGAPSALRIRQAHTLYWGILLMGSCAATVSTLALFGPAQWYGMNTVSGRMVVTTCARRVIAPRPVSHTAHSPSAMPSFAASLGCISRRGSGYCCTSGPMRRVWVPERNWLTTRPVVRKRGNSADTSSLGGRYAATLKRAFPSGNQNGPLPLETGL